jgi:hypothetical protein
MELTATSRRRKVLMPVAWAVSLVVASTGAATAGTLITSAQIKNNSILSADIRDNSITGADIKAVSIQPLDISLAAKTELADTSQIARYETVPGNNALRIETRCDPLRLQYAVGGGVKASVPDDVWRLVMRESYPSPDNKGWVVTVSNPTTVNVPTTFYAMCSGPVRG